ncbi:Eco57I restriction-modification methylase domain-containing protein [Melioribacteraceae bacterium 4301-Me]|uniref:Eco57I restriction-modification methylase domain-containing protein n=1 Tax=Pyranulibacter aquaticus TaxID=3163344 RepID=UPI00359940EB
MEIKDILKSLTEKFNFKDLSRLFRNKTRTFREIDEPLSYLNDENFSDCKLFGEFKLENSDEMVIVTTKVNKPLSERTGKKAQYTLGKKFLKDTQRYVGGFFIFYDDKGDFRFSLIYDIPLATGKRDWSNFRRYTYFVSKEQTNKTFIQQMKEAKFSSLDSIIEAFSVEKVTKEFYQEIANWYFWAMDKVQFPDDEEKDKEKRNAKNLIRLITRIIFIWFMKEKELVPPTLFDKSFIDKIINYKDKTGSTYYKAILQNLFFATLNTYMKKDNKESRIFVEEAEKKGYLNDAYLQQGYYRYSRFIKDKKLFLEQFENVPFLNGGLFECLDKKIDGKEIRIDCFSDNPKNETRLKVPDELFFLEEETETDLSNYLEKGKNKKVTGLLTILKRYNFTIDENTPIDQDVALDPELLGKVFENLLASYNPETATTARKATGSYYTPREIVEYMVNESLVAHLKTVLNNDNQEIEQKLRMLFDYASEENPFDAQTTLKLIDAIEKIKILDPACGSGAFPMGVLHKLVLALHKLDPDNRIWKQRVLDRVPPEIRSETEQSLQNKSIDYIRKLGLIEHCIYGVDIQEIAIQISKLRFFISLLVEQRIDDTKPNRDIRALPNLETKFVAANTLIGLERPEQLNLIPGEVEELEKQLFKVREEIFYTNSRKEKLELQRKEKQLREKLKIALNHNGFQNDVAEKITSWDPFDQNTHADWFDPEWMFGVKDSFDIVIGNPPYIKEYTRREAFDGLRSSPYYQGKMDIWYLFACIGIDLLKQNGILTFIAQNNWVTSFGASKLRKKVITETVIRQLIDFNDYKIFENAGIQTMIMIFQKDNSSDNYKIDYRKILSQEPTFKDVIDILQKNKNENIQFLISVIHRESYIGRSLTFNDNSTEKILHKIYSITEDHLKENEITQGIVCPQDYVIKTTLKILGKGYQIGDGIFVLSDNEKEKIPFNREELKLLKPYYTTKELDRYYAVRKNSEWIIYTGSQFKDPKNIRPYPNIKKHLDKFQNVITSDNKPYGLHRARDEKFFKGEKIIAVRKCIRPTFTYTDFECYVSAAFYIIKTSRFNLKYLTGLLNSRLIEFWLKHKGKMQGNNYQIDKEPLLNIPLPSITTANQSMVQQIEVLVDKILAAKKQNPQADTSAWEKEIDNLVYQLYELTPEEIEIIEWGK